MVESETREWTVFIGKLMTCQTFTFQVNTFLFPSVTATLLFTFIILFFLRRINDNVSIHFPLPGLSPNIYHPTPSQDNPFRDTRDF